MMKRDDAIAAAINFMRESGCRYDKVWHVMYHNQRDLDSQLELLWEEFIRHDPKRHNEAAVANARIEIDALKAANRPHWSISFYQERPPGIVSTLHHPVVNVYDDGATEFADV